MSEGTISAIALNAAISGSISAEPEACLAGGCRAGLTPRVKILPDEVNAKATHDTDKDGGIAR